MESANKRRLVFSVQPKDTISGETSDKIRVSVVDENGNPDSSYDPLIRLLVEDATPAAEDVQLRPLNAIPKRLRAIASGCEDAISDVFYLLPK